MSDLSRLKNYIFNKQGDMSPEAFVLKQVDVVRSFIGKPATNEALDKTAEQVKVLKAEVEAAVDKFLADKLEAGVADIAETVSDGVLNAIQTFLLGLVSKAKGNEQ